MIKNLARFGARHQIITEIHSAVLHVTRAITSPTSLTSTTRWKKQLSDGRYPAITGSCDGSVGGLRV